MRDTVPEEVITADHRVVTRLSSWRDGEILAGDIPLEEGVLEVTGDAVVPGRLDLSLPQTVAPSRWSDPIGTYGQRINVEQVITAASGEYTVNLGWYLIQGWEHVFPNVEVEALSLEQLIADYRFQQPFSSSASDTYGQVLGRLVKGLLPLDTSAMTDRSVGAQITQDEDRAAAVNNVRTDWPADIRVDDDAVLVATPPAEVKATPDRSFRHGEADAFVSIGTSSLRDEVFNAVVARGEKPDGTPVQAVAVDEDWASPTYYYGPFGRRNRFYSSPFITSVAQARSAAQRVLRRELRRAALVNVIAPPDPRLEVGDTIAVTTAGGTTVKGLLADISLPLVANMGPATYGVQVDNLAGLG